MVVNRERAAHRQTKNIFYADNNIKRLSDTVCGMLGKMSTWFAVNRLTLNTSKTNYMLFGNCMLTEDVVINIQNVNIDRVRVATFYGCVC